MSLQKHTCSNGGNLKISALVITHLEPTYNVMLWGVQVDPGYGAGGYMKETKDVDTAGSFGQMSFCQVDIDYGHGKQAGNDLHTCTLYICGSWAPKEIQKR